MHKHLEQEIAELKEIVKELQSQIDGLRDEIRNPRTNSNPGDPLPPSGGGEGEEPRGP